MSKFFLRPTEQKKLRSLFCQVCGRWAKDKVEDEEKECSTLEDLMLEDGAVPVVRFCSECKHQLVNVLNPPVANIDPERAAAYARQAELDKERFG